MLENERYDYARLNLTTEQRLKNYIAKRGGLLAEGAGALSASSRGLGLPNRRSH